MASRMDRYYSSGNKERSELNQDLYREKQNVDYDHLKRVDSIDDVNQIDIDSFKELNSSREKYKQERMLRQTIKNSNIKLDIDDTLVGKRYDILDVKPKELEEQEIYQEKNYDVKDLINKARDDQEEDYKSRNLKDLDYQDINELKLHKKSYKDSEAELKDIINTISTTSKFNKLGDDVGLLDELKSDTIVGDTSSIKKMLDEEEKIETNIKKDDTKELDKSFFTNTYDFKGEDFDEELYSHNKKKKKTVIIIIIVLAIIITAVVLYFLGFIPIPFNFKKN